MIKKFFERVLQKSRSGAKQAPKVVSVAQLGIDASLISPNAVKVCEVLRQANHQAFVVGGAVRDLLLKVTPKDFDVATDATPEQVERLFRRSRIIGRRFRIVHVMFGRETIEVTTFRGASVEAAPKDEHGRVLTDNTYGTLATDAQRRDFTVNAFYYEPHSQTVLDHCGGLKDLEKKTLRVIGDPEARFREDPVRMLRAVRFAAKLNFGIEKKTMAAIAPLADLILNVPPARLFDEIQKLLLSGHAVATLKRLRGEGLHDGLLPLLDVVLDDPLGERFVFAALANTDERVLQGRSVTPSFLFAALLWHQVLVKAKAYEAQGEYTHPALSRAMGEVLDVQCESMAIPRRYTADMREIWSMQPRFDKRSRSAFKFVEHPRFRAAYDFYLLRAQGNEADEEAARWWTDFVAGDQAEREALVQALSSLPRSGEAASKKRRRRGGRPAGASQAPETKPASESVSGKRPRRPGAILTTAAIGLGANLADRHAQLASARQAIRQLPRTHETAFSSLFESAPVDAGGPDYLNAVMLVDTDLSPLALLDGLLTIEAQLGRQRSFRNAPRSIDLDLLLYGEQTIRTDALQVPHPRMHQRAFVLLPLLQVWPEVRIPGLGPAQQFLAQVSLQPVRKT